MTGVPKIIFFHETPRGRTAPQRGNRDLTCTFYVKRFQNAAEHGKNKKMLKKGIFMAVYAWSDSPKYPIMANGTLRFFRHPFMHGKIFEGKTVFEKYYRGELL